MQHECIPQAILGMDVLCQAKSGMGKTAVFVLSVLQQIEPATPPEVAAIVLCHTRELAYQVPLDTKSCPRGTVQHPKHVARRLRQQALCARGASSAVQTCNIA